VIALRPNTLTKDSLICFTPALYKQVQSRYNATIKSKPLLDDVAKGEAARDTLIALMQGEMDRRDSVCTLEQIEWAKDVAYERKNAKRNRWAYAGAGALGVLILRALVK